MKLKTSFEFDSAHRLVGYQGKCSNLHGHIWKCELEIEGKGLDCNGILWDFTNAKEMSKILDHKTILKDCKENKPLIDAIIKTCGKDAIYLMEENPTAENLCEEILAHCKTSNPDLKYKVTVWESPKSSCEVLG